MSGCHLLDLSMVWARDELLQVCKTIGLSKCKHQFSFNECFPGLLTGHLQISNKILKLLCINKETLIGVEQ